MSSRGWKRAAVAVGVFGASTLAMATPPALAPITFPVDTSSVVAEVAAAGGTILLLIWGLRIAFRLANKLFSRGANSV